MKRVLLLIASVTLVGTICSFAVARWMTYRHESITAGRLNDPSWLKAQLGLSDSQATEVEKSESEYLAKVESLCVAHCAARFSLGEELAKPKPDVDKARSYVEKMNAVQADAERATLDHFLRVRALLSEQQAARYTKIIQEQVCTSCPMGIHKPS